MQQSSGRKAGSGRGKPFGRAGGSAGRRPSRAPERRARGEVDAPALLYGWHTVVAALANPARNFRKLMVTENALRRLGEEEQVRLPIAPDVVRPDALASLLPPDAVHQGLLAEADPLPALAVEELPPDGIVLVLDQITDPHNVGAILRSAAAFGARGVILPVRHSPEATGVLAKAASGALEFVPLVPVVNLARALEELKTRGTLTLGLDSAAPHDLRAVPMREPLALVLGAEGKGLRQKTRETCEVLTRLDLPGQIKALNVSNAAAIALFAATAALAKRSDAA